MFVNRIRKITSDEKRPNRLRKKKQKLLLEFSNTENMIQGIIFLYRKYPDIKSSLYKTSNQYQLLLEAPAYKNMFFMNEFCRINSSLYKAEYTKEHGKILSEGSAVGKIGSAFSKSN